MGNFINRSANQTSDEYQPNNSQQRTNNSIHDNQINSGQPNQNRSRLRFSTSLLSLSNFTSKHFSRSYRSYSVTNVDQTTNASKSLHQVIKEMFLINFYRLVGSTGQIHILGHKQHNKYHSIVAFYLHSYHLDNSF